MSTRRTLLRSGLVAVAILVAACSSSVEPIIVEPPSGPVDREELIGSYTAIGLSATVGGQPVDLLAAGGSMTLTLDASAQFNAQIMAPGLGVGGADVSEIVQGTWTYDAVTRRVRFPTGPGFLGMTLVPSRGANPVVIVLTGTIPAGIAPGVPAIDAVLEKP
jgi:hypothetical protein